jgi:surface protein
MLSAIQSFVEAAQQQAQPATFTPIVFTANVARAAGGTGSTANTLRANIYSGSNVSIDWGDGNISNVTTAGTVTKTYANNTTLKTIQVSGTVGLGWIGNDGNRIIDVTSWGNSPVFSAERMFTNARGLTSFTATGQPNFTSGASTANMFNGANTFNQDLSNWETGNITDMSAMFRNASAFNSNLSGWCVTLVTTTPFAFDTGANAWTMANSRPVWGTCPP